MKLSREQLYFYVLSNSFHFCYLKLISFLCYLLLGYLGIHQIVFVLILIMDFME